MTSALSRSDYAELRNRVAQALKSGRIRARRAVEDKKIQTYHEVGRMIHQHLLGESERADYGTRMMARLADDLDIARQRLYEALRFFRKFPNIQTSGGLGWSHYHLLLGVASQSERDIYEREAHRNKWSTRALKAQIRAGAFKDTPEEEAPEAPAVLSPDAVLPPLRGYLYTCRVLRRDRPPIHRLDLGFGIHPALPIPGLSEHQDGDLLTCSKADTGYALVPASGRRAAFYTYLAHVDVVVDGDTLWLDIDCGFHIWTRQKVRLRGIDTPETASPAGQRAKSFVRSRLEEVDFVVVTTTVPDKYDRYLADVFYLPGESDPTRVLDSGHYLNRQLLLEGFATRYRGTNESVRQPG